MATSGDWPIEAVWRNEDNPRTDIKGDPNFAGLVASIKSQGIIQPLLINSEGMILAGHRRYEAALELGLQRLPVRVLGNHLDWNLIPLIENLQRADLKVLEVADYLLAVRADTEMTFPEISAITGISDSTIRNYIKLAEAPKEIRERVERDEIPLNAAFELLRHDEKFISEVVKEPKLTRQIVRERARTVVQPIQPIQPKQPSEIPRAPIMAAPRVCPKDRVPHIKHAMNVVRELLAAAPDEAFETRYKRWLTIMEADLQEVPDISESFRGATDYFQRQPVARPR